MFKYSCNQCNYYTNYLSNFKRHNNSKKHKSKINLPVESVTQSHDKPVYNVRPIINIASIIKVLPSAPVNFKSTGPIVNPNIPPATRTS